MGVPLVPWLNHCTQDSSPCDSMKYPSLSPLSVAVSEHGNLAFLLSRRALKSPMV